MTNVYSLLVRTLHRQIDTQHTHKSETCRATISSIRAKKKPHHSAAVCGPRSHKHAASSSQQSLATTLESPPPHHKLPRGWPLGCIFRGDGQSRHTASARPVRQLQPLVTLTRQEADRADHFFPPKVGKASSSLVSNPPPPPPPPPPPIPRPPLPFPPPPPPLPLLQSRIAPCSQCVLVRARELENAYDEW